jgi:hypothetical protein
MLWGFLLPKRKFNPIIAAMKSLFRFTVLLLIVCMFGLAGFGQQATTVNSKCPYVAFTNTTTATVQLIAAPTNTAFGKRLMLCHVDILVKQTTGAADFGLITGTGTNCGTGGANLTPQWVGTASVIDKYNQDFGLSPIPVTANKAVCLKLSATPTNAQAMVTYGYF